MIAYTRQRLSIGFIRPAQRAGRRFDSFENETGDFSRVLWSKAKSNRLDKSARRVHFRQRLTAGVWWIFASVVSFRRLPARSYLIPTTIDSIPVNSST